ncbi:MAG: hypothetical protein ACRD50_05480 [Candidatus Acidiferrales bacterium]
MTPDNVIGAGVVAPNRMSYTEEFKSRVDLMKAFCETAKTYIQISSAALALPILFTQALLGKEAAERGLRTVGVPSSLVLAWISFLLAVGFGLLYQWLAIRLMWDELHRVQIAHQNITKPGFRTTWWVPQLRWLNRSLLYGCMLVFFYVGGILFVVFATHAIRE